MKTIKDKETAQLNQHLQVLVSVITIRKELRKQQICGKIAITKPLVTDVNAKRYLK